MSSVIKLLSFGQNLWSAADAVEIRIISAKNTIMARFNEIPRQYKLFIILKGFVSNIYRFGDILIVIITGSPGSGKSTLAEKIASKFKLRCVFASDILRRLQKAELEEIDLDKTEKSSGFWESDEGKEYLAKRAEDESFDRKLDEELLRIINEGDNLVVDSWTMPWLSEKGFKIWLNASPSVRALRVSGRDSIEKEKALERIEERNEKTAAIYKKLYGFDYGQDFTPFDLVLNTDELSQEDVFEVVELVLKRVFSE